jgi:predicted membrane metal-binding protein
MRWMAVVRYVLPAVLLLVGIVLFAIEPNAIGIEGFAMAAGAAIALLLLNLLFRAGVSGDREREREQAAREYFAQHGRWPDEER